MFDKNEIQPKIHFDRSSAHHTSHWIIEIDDLYYIEGHEYLTFWAVMNDMGITHISPDRLKLCPDAKNCYHEIRLTGFQLWYHLPFPANQTEPIRYELFADAWHGLRNIFSRQMHPEAPQGINFIEKWDETGERSLENYMSVRIGYDPEEEPEELIELTPIIENAELVQGQEIAEYQIRLLYDDPNAVCEDLFSAFNYINNRLCNPFELIVEN